MPTRSRLPQASGLLELGVAGQGFDEANVPFFGAFATAWDDAMVARWSANPLGILWPKRDARLLSFFNKPPGLVSVLGGIGA